MAGNTLYQLEGTCTEEPWGKVGQQSLAAQYRFRTPETDFVIEEHKTYSSLAFGQDSAHILKTGESLKDTISKNPKTLLGQATASTPGQNLLFSPQILSIENALPLCGYSTEALIAAFDPDNQNGGRQPKIGARIAIALSHFEAFVGIKSTAKVETLFKHDALSKLAPKSADRWSSSTVQATIQSILSAEKDVVEQASRNLIEARESLGASSQVVDILSRLQQHPQHDTARSLIAATCMEYLTIEPLEALHLEGGQIFAYLHGNTLEVTSTANKSEVVLQKSDVLLTASPSQRGSSGLAQSYHHSKSDVHVDMLGVKAGEHESLTSIDRPSIAIVTQGKGSLKADKEKEDVEIKEGYLFYFAPGLATKWTSESGMQVFLCS